MQRTYAKKAACTNNTKLLAADNTAHEGVLKYHFYTNIFFHGSQAELRFTSFFFCCSFATFLLSCEKNIYAFNFINFN